MVGRGDLVGLAPVVGVGVAAAVGVATATEGAAVAAGVAGSGDNVALDAHAPRSPRTARLTSNRRKYPRPSIANDPPRDAAQTRFGLPRGSARSRQPRYADRASSLPQ